MARCEVCGKEELLPFICSHCGRTLCSEHRLPETHNCSAILGSQPVFQNGGAGRFSAPRMRHGYVHTSRTELLHLSIAILIFFLVVCLGFILSFRSSVVIFVVGGGTVLAFVSHELAHKFTAQRYGLWSEFRLDPVMAVFSLITVIPLIPIKIIAPGAVVIFGYSVTLEQMGKTSLAGALVNIFQALLFYTLAPYMPELYLVAYINAYLAMFNLIPISVLDGRKVFAWNKIVWALCFVSAFLLWVRVYMF